MLATDGVLIMVAATGFEALRLFIIQTRHAKRLTQRDVAKRGGIPHGTIGSIESGKEVIPTQETLAGIARGLGVPYQVLDRLARGLPQMPDMSVADLVTIWTEDDPEIRGLLIEAASLPPDRRDSFAAGLRALVAALRPTGG